VKSQDERTDSRLTGWFPAARGSFGKWSGPLSGSWRGLSGFQKRLAAGNTAYLCLLLVYVFVWQSDIAKYALVLSGVALAATIPELASKELSSEKRHAFRLTLLCIPAIAIALVQILSDRENDRKQLALSQQLATLQLGKSRGAVREAEAERQEGIVLDPRDTIEAIKNANEGFVVRADMLALHIASREARLAASVPSLSGQLPADTRSRVEFYRSLRNTATAMPSVASQAQAEIDDIILLLEAEVAYRDLAEIFVQKIKPEYAEFLSQNASGHTFDEMRNNLWGIYRRVRALGDVYDLAGLNNHLGLLAMASGHAAEGLSQFYHGYERDREHLPIYETLGYALWSVDNDVDGAFKFAALGLEEAESLHAILNREANALSIPQKEIFTKLIPEWNAFIAGMTTRLKLQYAYFGALGVQNEEIARIARRYARELYDSNENDAEYQDVLGFVLMRLGDPSELDEAQKLFEAAIGNPSAERITPRLAEQHASELQRLRRTLNIPTK
jgi:hypothetical protein